MSKRAEQFAASVGASAARKSAEPEFIVPAAGAPPKRARKKPAAAEEATPGLLPRQRRVYTSFAIDTVHYDKICEVAWERKRSKQTTKFDMSAPLRDVLDYYIANEKEVNDWIAKGRSRAQGNR